MKLICPLAKYFARSKDIILELLWQLYVYFLKLKYKREICPPVYFDSNAWREYSVMISIKQKSKRKQKQNIKKKKNKKLLISLAS